MRRGVNRGLNLSCMFEVAEKQRICTLERGFELRILRIGNEDSRDRIGH